MEVILQCRPMSVAIYQAARFQESIRVSSKAGTMFFQVAAADSTSYCFSLTIFSSSEITIGCTAN